MSFEFTESVNLVLPDVKNQLENITEGVKGNSKIIVEIAAIHEGLTANYNHYSAEALEKSLGTWTSPYPKPIITNHDPDSDPLGRAMAATMKKELDGMPYIALQAAITSPNAVERLGDKRYLTGSVGGKAGKVLCSVCNTDWAKPSESLPCKHKRGQVYNGKLAFFDMHDISWKEYSFVNIPADEQSGIRDIGNTEEAEDPTVKIYSMDLNSESIYELTENDQSEDILKNMKKKDAHFTYMNLKGTFLSVSAFDDRDHLETAQSEKSDFIEDNTTMNNESDEECDMSDTQTSVTEDENDDVLSAMDSLSADLAATTSTEESEKTEEASTEEADTETEVITDADESDEKDAETEVIKDEDALTDSDQSDLDAAETETSETTEASAEESDPAELDALRQENSKLTEENAKLKSAIRSMLVERVVDTKIALGLVEKTERAESITEHGTRSVSSLADNLRDLAKMTPVLVSTTSTESIPTLDVKSRKVGDESNTHDHTESTKAKRDYEADLEQKLVDALMNRTKL